MEFPDGDDVRKYSVEDIYKLALQFGFKPKSDWDGDLVLLIKRFSNCNTNIFGILFFIFGSNLEPELHGVVSRWFNNCLSVEVEKLSPFSFYSEAVEYP